MHSSIFSYNVNRPYPFKWCNPAVVVVGVVALILVNIINVATSGFQLISTSSTNPNVTEAASTWIGHWPSFMIGKMRATCESATTHLNSQMYTNNTALSYTLRSVWQEDDAVVRIMSGSLIQLRSLDRIAAQILIQQIGASLTAFTTCHLDPAEGVVSLNLTTTCELVPDTATGAAPFLIFPGQNATSKASLFFCKSLLYIYWNDLTNTYYIEKQRTHSNFFQSSLAFARSQVAPDDANEVQALVFFQPRCAFVPFGRNGTEPSVMFCPRNPTLAGLRNGQMGGIWTPADTVAKALYYTILADLGQNTSSYRSPLVDPGLLKYYTPNFTDIMASVHNASHPFGESVGRGQHVNTGLATTPYSGENASTYSLGVDPSTSYSSGNAPK